MSVQYWGDMSLLDGSIELAGNAKNVQLAAEVDVKDTTPLSTTGWTTVIAGNRTATISMDLMTDMVAAGIDATEWGYLGLSGVPKSICTASADGSVAYLMNGINLSYHPVLGANGEIAMSRIAGKSSGSPLVRGALIHPGSVTRTSSSTGSWKVLTAATSGQTLYAALHVLSVAGTGSPTLTVKVQSDDTGHASPVDQITFTAATARTYEWKSLAGANTDTDYRISYTISGTSPQFVFAVTVGIA